MRLSILALLTATALSTAALAQEIPVLSGGVGLSDRAEIEAQQHNYHLKLVFSGQGGAFLAGVLVNLTDKAGNSVLSAVTDGPILLSSPPAGTYKMTASVQGVEKTLNVTVPATGLKTYQIGFPIRDDDDLTDANGVYRPRAQSTLDYVPSPVDEPTYVPPAGY